MEVVPFNGGGGSGEHSISQSCEEREKVGLACVHCMRRSETLLFIQGVGEQSFPIGSVHALFGAGCHLSSYICE